MVQDTKEKLYLLNENFDEAYAVLDYENQRKVLKHLKEGKYEVPEVIQKYEDSIPDSIH